VSVRARLTVDPGKRLDALFGPEHPRRWEVNAIQKAEKIMHGQRPVIHPPPDGVPNPLDPIRHQIDVPVLTEERAAVSRPSPIWP
jgi:hypothetical protein